MDYGHFHQILFLLLLLPLNFVLLIPKKVLKNKRIKLTKHAISNFKRPEHSNKNITISIVIL